ncbi:MAG TPA: GntR family transcriptional regulator, partial [Streptosporangiaceae bacterium]|nr:GntR family transcriptional regulator [Streptosporangiaceae bacterium]
MSGATGTGTGVSAGRRRQLAERILAACHRDGLGPGSRLPTERQLALDLGTTRTSLRHALAVLEADGWISREVGRGTYLRGVPGSPPPGPALLMGAPGGRPPGPALLRGSGREPAGLPGPGGQDTFRAVPAAAAPGPAVPGRTVPGRTAARAGAAEAAAAGISQAGGPDDGAGYAPADVMTIRRMVEPAAMQLVVAWANAADFAEIERCLAGGERADGYDEFEAWDLALHRSLMTASHSPLLVRLYGLIEDARHGQSWGDLKRRS